MPVRRHGDNLFGPGADAVGKTVRVANVPFVVVGVAVSLVAQFWTEVLWFDSVGYRHFRTKTGAAVWINVSTLILPANGQNGPLATKLTKELAWRGLHQHPEEALRYYAAATALIHQTDDAKEGPRAFAEKRKPQWTGR